MKQIKRKGWLYYTRMTPQIKYPRIMEEEKEKEEEEEEGHSIYEVISRQTRTVHASRITHPI